MGQSRCRGAAGFTMLEALVAIVILAFGVLGVANLLVKSFRFAQQSSYDVVALQMANDMADRMRANDAAMLAKAYDNFDSNSGIPAVPAPANLYKTGCTGASAACALLTAAFDQGEWARQVQAALPGGRVLICRDANAFNVTSGYDWPCTVGATTTTPLVVKIGWVSRFSDTAETQMADSRTADGIAKPQIVVVVTPGVNN